MHLTDQDNRVSSKVSSGKTSGKKRKRKDKRWSTKRRKRYPEKQLGPNQTLVQAGAIARCLDCTVMSVTRYRREFGLPYILVHCDATAEGMTFVYDLDRAERWAKKVKLRFDREQAFDRALPTKGIGATRLKKQRAQPRPVPRIPREDQASL
jgi:hypothetical protein